MIGYLLIRLFTLPLAYMPYSWIHALGRALGPLAYRLLPKWRKRALSNIALALPLEDPEKLARACFQSLLITFLEYPKLAREKKMSHIVFCDNPDQALEILKSGKGIIFFCGHQANWELLFLEGTSRMPGVAIGRPVKNRHLYAWIKRMREKFGGTIITPKEAVKEGLRALKRGKFLGIVGDQGMPESGFQSPFLGRLAWTSPLPALLSTRSGAPIIVASVAREKGKYRIHYSEPLYPAGEEVDQLMKQVLGIFEKSILEHPDQWLWIHNRWKQQSLSRIKRPYREDAIAIFLPESEELALQADAFRKLYPTEWIICFVPETLANRCTLPATTYRSIDELFKPDFRFKLIYNFTGDKRLDKHYKKYSALNCVHLDELKPGNTLYERLCQTIAIT